MIVIKPDRTAFIPEAERRIGFESDHLVERRCFEITDPALFAFSFKLDIENTADIVDLTDVETTDLHRVLAWDITDSVLGEGGIIHAQLRAFNSDGTRVWHSAHMEFIAGHSVHAVQNASTERTVTEFEQIETRVQSALGAAQTASTEAQNARDGAVEAQAKTEQAAALYEALCETIETLAAETAAHALRTDNPHRITPDQIGAYTQEQTDQKLSEKAPLDHTHALLPPSLALGDTACVSRTYNMEFSDCVSSFSDLAITGATTVTAFRKAFQPYMRTASSRWIRISVPYSLLPQFPDMPYTLHLKLTMGAIDGVLPLEVMGMYKNSSGTDVRVTPVNTDWQLLPGESKDFVFNLPPQAGTVQNAGFSIDLRAANEALFNKMRFCVDVFTVLPCIYLESAEKPAYMQMDDRFILPADAPAAALTQNQFWYANGAVQSYLVEPLGNVGTVTLNASLSVAERLIQSDRHRLRTDNPHAVTPSQIGAASAQHTHAIAKLNASNLLGIPIFCSSYENSTAPTIAYSTYDGLADEYTFPNDQYYSSFSLFEAGDRVSLQITAQSTSLTVNGVTTRIDDTYTLPETLLTQPIDVSTEFGAEVKIRVLSAPYGSNGFMSMDDKRLLRNLQTHLTMLENIIRSKL